MTPTHVRNAIRRSLKELIAPKPTSRQKESVWEHFGHQCAFCSRPLNKNRQQGRIDHLVPESIGGTNQLANLILTCPSCSGNKKRDKDWLDFLKTKCDDNLALYERRLTCILHWQQSQPGPVTLTQAQQQLLDDTFEQVNTAYSLAVKELGTQNKRTK